MAIFNENSLPSPLSECAVRAGGDGEYSLFSDKWIRFGYGLDTVLDIVCQKINLVKSGCYNCLDIVDIVITNSYARECYLRIYKYTDNAKRKIFSRACEFYKTISTISNNKKIQINQINKRSNTISKTISKLYPDYIQERDCFLRKKMQGFEDIEERLANWSRVYRDSRNPQSVSSTYTACIQANKFRGCPENWCRLDERTNLPDFEDAEIVNKAFMMLDGKSKRNIVEIWILWPDMSIDRIAYKKRIRRVSYENIYRRSLALLRANIDRFCGDLGGKFARAKINACQNR